jgi:hypothetical protein
VARLITYWTPDVVHREKVWQRRYSWMVVYAFALIVEAFRQWIEQNPLDVRRLLGTPKGIRVPLFLTVVGTLRLPVVFFGIDGALAIFYNWVRLHGNEVQRTTSVVRVPQPSAVAGCRRYVRAVQPSPIDFQACNCESKTAA